MEEGDYESVDSNSSGEEGIGHRREQGKGHMGKQGQGHGSTGIVREKR